MKLNFFLAQLQLFSLTRNFLLTLNFSSTFATNFVKPIEFRWSFRFYEIFSLLLIVKLSKIMSTQLTK